MKYGKEGSIVFVWLLSETLAKYAYTPFGNSSVLQNLPLCSSKLPSSGLYCQSSTKNPSTNSEWSGRSTTLVLSNLYPEVIIPTVGPNLLLSVYAYGP